MVPLVALLSSGVWGTADFVGGLWSKRFHPVQVVTFSQLGGLAAVVVFFGITSMSGGHGSSPWTTWAAWGVGAGLSGVVGLLCLYAALAVGTMGVVSPITALGAVVPVVLGLALHGDSWGVLVGVGLAVALAGAILASGPELSGDVGRRPVLLACVAALGFGLSLYCMDGGSRHDLSGSMLFMRCASLTVLVPMLLVARSRGAVTGLPHGRDAVVLPLLGVGDLTANVLFAWSSARGAVSIMSVLGSLYPVATLLWARFLLGERMRPVQLLGVAMTVVGVILVTR